MKNKIHSIFNYANQHRVNHHLAGQTTYPGFGVGPASISGTLAARVLLEFGRVRSN